MARILPAPASSPYENPPGMIISWKGSKRTSLDKSWLIWTTEGSAPLRASYIAIANQHPYTYFGKLPVKATPLAGFDTALDAVVLGRLGKRALPRLALYALAWPRHAHTATSGITYLHDRHRLEIECDRPLGVQIDGEYVGVRERIEVGYEADAVQVFVPCS